MIDFLNLPTEDREAKVTLKEFRKQYLNEADYLEAVWKLRDTHYKGEITASAAWPFVRVEHKNVVSINKKGRS